MELKYLKDTLVTKISAGGSNGSIIILDLSSDSQKYELFIYCAWRLSKSNSVLSGSNDSDAVFTNHLKELEGLILTDVYYNNYGDFTLSFNEIELMVFCDITSTDADGEEQENWTICNIAENRCISLKSDFNFHPSRYSEN